MISRLSHRIVIALAFTAALVLFAPSSASAATKAAPQLCGGFFGLMCGANQFCQFKPGTCGFADLMGQCTKVPTACIRIFRPVCGCDGKTYSNDCVRQAARVSKKSDGRCRAAL